MSPAANPPPVSHAAFNRRLVLLVLASFLIFAAAVVLRFGIGATPYDTTDSAGRTMGFNDPLSAEHFGIIIRHFRPAELLHPEYAYEWLLFAMHVLGAWLLLAGRRVPVRLTRWFFAAQPILFPVGLVFCWVPLLLVFASGPMDREGFIDVPFIMFFAQPVWVLASLILTFTLRGPGLGLAKVWRAFLDAACAGGRVFVNAVR